MYKKDEGGAVFPSPDTTGVIEFVNDGGNYNVRRDEDQTLLLNVVEKHINPEDAANLVRILIQTTFAKCKKIKKKKNSECYRELNVFD